MPKRSSSDLNQNAFRVVQKSTSQTAVAGSVKAQPDKNPAAVALGRLGGLKGGTARARSLTPERRKDIARKAAEQRWSREK